MGATPNRNFSIRAGSDMLKNDPLSRIREKALWMRRTAFGMVHRARAGQSGRRFFRHRIMAMQHFGVLNHDPHLPDWADRGPFIMSKGHANGALHSVLAAAGYFAEDWSATYLHPKSLLNGHPNCTDLPHIRLDLRWRTARRPELGGGDAGRSPAAEPADADPRLQPPAAGRGHRGNLGTLIRWIRNTPPSAGIWSRWMATTPPPFWRCWQQTPAPARAA